MSDSTATATGSTQDNATPSLYEEIFGYQDAVQYPEETLAPLTCADQMAKEVTTYWNMLYAMMALVLLTMVAPYVFLCCSKRLKYKCLASFYYTIALVTFICGVLLSTDKALMPDCLLECGAFFCSLHEYNPGPLYGAIVIVLSFVWTLKGCMLSYKGRQAKAQKNGDGGPGYAEGQEDKESNDIAEIL